MKAIVLAAGRGKRLGSDRPKSLSELGEGSLLSRMLVAIDACGVSEITVVSGFQAPVLEAAAKAVPLKQAKLRTVENPEFTRGSVVSLLRGAEVAFGADDVLIMDADVLFPRALLRRLIDSKRQNAFLLDRRSEMGGEEMMLAARNGRVLRIARRVDARGYEVLGEGVGFLKLRAADQPLLMAELERLIAEKGPDREYEEAIDRLLGRLEVGYEEVGETPWTEVDFAEDLALARDELLPQVEALDDSDARLRRDRG